MMAATPYQPTSWTSEPVTQAKLQQMSNNDQWLFENMPKIRYTNSGIIKDTGVKMIVGKTPFAASTINVTHVTVNFGNFFSPGCHPIVTATIEAGVNAASVARTHAVLFGNGNIATGFDAAIAGDTYRYISNGGWLHWQAVGY